MKTFKSTTLNRSLSILLVSLLILTGCNTRNKDIKKVKVGCNLPLTGVLSVYGNSVRDGVLLGLTDLEDSLTSNSINLNFDFQDNQGINRNALNIYQKHFISGVDIYMSGVTQQTMAILDQVASKEVPHFIWAFTPLYLEMGMHTFRTYVNFGVEADNYLKFIESKKPKRVAFIYVNISGTNIQFNEVVIPKIKEMGIDEIMSESYDISTSNYRDMAAKIRNFNPDIMIINGFKDNLIQLVKDFHSFDLFKNGNAMFAFDLLDAASDLDNKLIEGLYVTAPTYYLNFEIENVKNWNSRFFEKYKRMPLYTDAYAYDMTNIIFNAIKMLQKEEISLEQALLKTNLTGITGPLRFQENGELIYSLEICKYVDGKLTISDVQ